MNLFDNILNQSKNKFLGTQPSVPSTPSFATPQAPRTVNYTDPQVQQKPTMTLFSDEQKMFQKMKADNLDDNTAYSMLKKRRMDILGGNDITQEETDILKRMQADNVPVKQAVSMIQQRRKDQFNKKYEEGNLLQKGAYNTLAFAAGNLETLAKYSGNALDFITGGTMGFGDEVKKMEQVTQSPEFSQSSAFKAGTYAPDVALAVSPIGGGYLAGAKGLPQLAMRSGVVGAGFGGVQPILEQGSDVSIGDIATGAATGAAVGAVASPVLSKAFKYGQAGYYGGLEGAGKSIVRDVKGGLNAITPSGANISTKANRFNANEIREFTKTTGQSPGDFATSRGMTKVGDDAVVEATRLWQASKDQADDALKAIKGRFRFTDEGEDLLKTTLDDLETRLINTKSPDYKRISQLKAKYEDSGLTMSEINEIKRAYSKNYKYSFVDAGSESALRSRNLQDAVRKWQFKVAEENGLTNLKEINKTTQGWKMFADSLSKKIQGSSGNNNVSLTDWIALSGGSPENIAMYLGKKLASSDKVKSGAIKLFSKQTKPSIIQASKADIQQANFKKDVNRGVSGVGDNSGGKSLVRPVGLLPAPSGKATGAKNVRVNQPKEKTPIKNEGQAGKRPGTKPTVKPNSTTNAKQPRNIVKPSTKSDSDIPEGYFKNAFGEIVKNPSNKKGGFIRNPFAKPEPKRLFAGENSAQPPKGKTGWFKGADGKMRFEIDDSGAKVNANVDLTKNAKAVYLKYILEHKELYKNYPELSDTSVLFDKSVKEGMAHFDPKTGAIHLSYDEFINPNTGKIWGAGSSGTHDNIKSKLLHEIQHAIQNKEGFARGGSIDLVMGEIRNKINSLGKEMEKLGGKGYGTPEYNKIRSEYDSYIDIEKKAKTEPGKALELYKSLAGEVEARNVQSRMNLTAKERTIKKPESTEDVPRAKQIIRIDGKGPSMSIKVPEKKIVKPVEKTVKENKTVSKLEDYITSKIPEIENISDGTIYFKDGSKGELTMGTDWGKPQIIAIEVPNKRAGMGTKIINAMKEWSIGAGHNEIRLNNNVSPKFWEKMGFKGEGPNKYYDTKWIASQEDIINFRKNQPKPLSPQKTVKPLTPKKQSATMGDMETKKLIEEARKYKSAEEFINNQEKVFHGSRKNIGENQLMPGKGGSRGAAVYTTKDIEQAKRYGDINERFIPTNAKIFDFDNLSPKDIAKKLSEGMRKLGIENKYSNGVIESKYGRLDFEYGKDKSIMNDYLQGMKKDGIPQEKVFNAMGFDIAKMGEGETQIMIYNPNVLLTKAQLKKIYEQSKK